MSEIYKTPEGQAKAMISKPITVRASQMTDKFFGVPRGSEEADDVLFAVQAYYGHPEYDYEEVEGRFNEDQVKEAVDYVKKKGYNKFTYFNGDPYGEQSYDAYLMKHEPEELEKLENEWGWK